MVLCLPRRRLPQPGALRRQHRGVHILYLPSVALLQFLLVADLVTQQGAPPLLGTPTAASPVVLHRPHLFGEPYRAVAATFESRLDT